MKRLTVCLSIGLSVCLTNWGLYAVFCLLVQFTTFNITYCIHNIRLVLLSVYPSDICTYLYVRSSIRLSVSMSVPFGLLYWVRLSTCRSVGLCVCILMHVCLYVWSTPPLPFSGVLHFISSSIMPVNTTYHILTGSKFLYWSIKACIRSSNPSA